MTFEQTASQKLEFDVLFKNKKDGPAFVDGTVPVKFKNPNTGEELSISGATLSCTPVDPNEKGNSSKHHVKLETGAEDFTSVTTANIVAEPDIDIENDADDSTSDDVETKEFVLGTVVFKPLGASTVAVENVVGPVDVE